MKAKALIAYLSYSGNTEEVAEILAEVGREYEIDVDMHRIGLDRPVEAENYDYIFVGSFTWEEGSTPDEVKDFVLEIGYKPDNVAVFGTGDTQFGGEEYYCIAAVKLAHFYNSKWEVLKIEQSPRGSQELRVVEWMEGVLGTNDRNFA